MYNCARRDTTARSTSRSHFSQSLSVHSTVIFWTLPKFHVVSGRQALPMGRVTERGEGYRNDFVRLMQSGLASDRASKAAKEKSANRKRLSPYSPLPLW